jgi:hypothetical protein
MNRPDNLQVIATTWLLAGIFEFCRQRNISADLIVKNTTLDATTTNELHLIMMSNTSFDGMAKKLLGTLSQ